MAGFWQIAVFIALAATVPAFAKEKGDKNAAIDKVIDMLTELQEKVTEEGNKEAETYNKFACFCKDMMSEKTEAIEAGNDAKEDLTTSINDLSAERDELDEEIAELEADIAEAEKEVEIANKKRARQHKKYELNEADVSAGIAGLKGAIKEMKMGHKSSLLQLEGVKKTVSYAAQMADALGVDATQANRILAFFQQGDTSEVPDEEYEFHSGDIEKMLKDLLPDFEKQKEELDTTEEKQLKKHKAFIEEKEEYLKGKNEELDEAQGKRSKKVEKIENDNQQLTEIAANLLDDQVYLTDLAAVCNNKAKTWDQRSEARADELSAITAAITIIKGAVKDNSSGTIRFAQQGMAVTFAHQVVKDENAMAAIEADAEEDETPAAPSFLQRRSQPRTLISSLVKQMEKDGKDEEKKGPVAKAAIQPARASDGGRSIVIALLRQKGKQLKSSTLSALAEQIAADPFKKIKKLIQELIERLLQEAANEGNQKGWCDKAIADAEQRRDYAAEAIAELNAEMAELEATRDKLTEELATLKTEIAELKAAQEKAEKERAAEKAENAATVEEAEGGLEAVKMAIDILDKFYKSAANRAKKDPTALVQGPLDDMPDAGFDAGETYAGGQGASTGILGMLDVIKSDFVRTISKTRDAEAEAAKDMNKFDTETAVSLAEKTTAVEQKTKQLDDAVSKLEEADSEMSAQAELRDTAIKELIELQPNCVDTGMSYEERVARREQEIESLKQALCILEAYAEYGPDGIGDKC
eukprot:gnl/TRDRNA2_/TRDRNA2_177728_c0_seq13.p1 gnl/TRDRNA2_/TRDRNA2_177728_c0~~gnl/TRDRNA2_/TRDRNA2_177728_c0_seq13.p1  ORF type:complete len:755 (-),score=308.02 gnl/TRDRNA2_/TRDRNA2_177728_c0_seq13:244-2508(-)